MPLYINDPEVSRLADRLSKETGASKTEIIRRLLRAEAARSARSRTAEQRFDRIMEISRKGGEIARREHIPPYTKKEADEMFSYLDDGSLPLLQAKRK
jgi:hypothetical protein